MKAKARRAVKGKPCPAGQLSGEELTQLLRRLDAAQTEQDRRHWLGEYMRGFYGDNRGSELFQLVHVKRTEVVPASEEEMHACCEDPNEIRLLNRFGNESV